MKSICAASALALLSTVPHSTDEPQTSGGEHENMTCVINIEHLMRIPEVERTLE